MNYIHPMYTVGTLKHILKDIEDDVWVIVRGQGPAHMVEVELGANEPFIAIVGHE